MARVLGRAALVARAAGWPGRRADASRILPAAMLEQQAAGGGPRERGRDSRTHAAPALSAAIGSRRHLSDTPVEATAAEVPIAIGDATALLNAIASNYKSTPRVLMEYLDNALDSAEELRLQRGTRFRAEVHVDIDAELRRVWIRDNCLGMTPSAVMALIGGVGDSAKRDVSWMNGQFGFGVQAFRAAASELHVFSITDGRLANPNQFPNPPNPSVATVSVAGLHRDRATAAAPRAVALAELEARDPLVADAIRRGVFADTNGRLFPAEGSTEGFAETGAETVAGAELGAGVGEGRPGPAPHARGTAMLLLDVDPVWFDAIKARALCRSVESHFEGMLASDDLSVRVSQLADGRRDGKAPKGPKGPKGKDSKAKGRARRASFVCEAFDYSSLPGTRFQRSITVPPPAETSETTKAAEAAEANLEPAATAATAAAATATAATATATSGGEAGAVMRCDIVVSKSNLASKRVRFFKRGRCIGEVAEVSSFLGDSAHGAQLWEHPSVCGRIEVGDALEPVLTRDEFRRSAGRRDAYEALRPLEDDVKAALDAVVEGAVDDSMAEISSVLNDVLDGLLAKDEKHVKEEDAKAQAEAEAEAETAGEAGAHGEGESEGEGEGEGGAGAGADTAEAEVPVEVEGVTYEPVPRTTTRRRRERSERKRKAGLFDIKFVKAPTDAATEPQRSFAVDRLIYFNVDHDQFRLRLDRTRAGEVRMGARMAAYMSNELARHYRRDYYEQLRQALPEDRDKLYEDLLDSVNDLEEALHGKLAAANKDKSRPTDIPQELFQSEKPK